MQGFFTEFLVGELAFGDDFWSPSGMESDEGGLTSGMESDEGVLGKNCLLRPKNAPHSKIRANFGVLSIN